jgi:hypothetical protein
MRILLLSLSLFFTQNALTNNRLTEIMKTSVALNIAGGIVGGLLSPIPKDSKECDSVHSLTAIATITLNIAMIAYNFEKIGKYGPFCLFVGGIYSHLGAAIATNYVKTGFLSWYNK